MPAWAMGVPRPERGQRRLQVREERSRAGRGQGARGRSPGTRERFSPPGASGSPRYARRSSAFSGLCEPRGGSGPAQRWRGPLAFRTAPRSAASIARAAGRRGDERLGAVLPRWEQLCSGTGLRASKPAAGSVAITELVGSGAGRCSERSCGAPRVWESGGRLLSPCCLLKWISCFFFT